MSGVHAGYDAIGDRCLGHSQAGTSALANAVQDVYGGQSLGIYACRNTRGGTSKSAHAEGRAYDHAWTNQHTGQTIADRLVERHAELGIQVVIWWRRIWSYPRRAEGWRTYSGTDPHTGHLHIEQNWSGANLLTYAAGLNALAPLGHPEPPTTTPPAPEEDEDMFILNPVTDEPDQTQYFVNGDTYVALTADEAQQFRNSGFHTRDMEPLALAVFKQTAELTARP